MRISNCAHNEINRWIGGKAGDQTGHEWEIRNWYKYGNGGWKCVLRYPDAFVRDQIASFGEKAAKNNNVGYDMGADRSSYWAQLCKVNYDPAKIKVKCEADCSSGVIANVRAVGYLLNLAPLQGITATYTGNMRSAFKAVGFLVLTDKKYLVSDQYLMRGDILLNDSHHTCTVLDDGVMVTPTGPAPACPYSTPTVIVKKGSKGNGVRWVQWHLTRLGYDLSPYGIDGDFGSITDKCVRAFQRKAKITVDGQVGKITRAKLKTA